MMMLFASFPPTNESAGPVLSAKDRHRGSLNEPGMQ